MSLIYRDVYTLDGMLQAKALSIEAMTWQTGLAQHAADRTNNTCLREYKYTEASADIHR
jgi:hypothetical protein